ncbi:MAG: ChaN family lipoprotein [Chromatiaceae bacterium]|nr:ChaN family lipoprotein [Chromatiaceae bacterium]
MAPIVVESAKSATLPQLMRKLAAERLIYVGETHTALADHQLQLEVLRGMAERPAGLALGVEWFQKRFQPVLDDYLAGRIDEAEMLRRTEYYERWRFDYRLYRPIVRFAKEHAIPIVALNASRELTSEIRRVGINDLPAELREELPDSYDLGDKDYEELLREMFDLHPSGDGQFQRFHEVQLTWDESMAQAVSEYLNSDPQHRMLVLAGRGHIAGRYGIPNRVARRTGVPGKTIASFNPSGGKFNTAEYLVLANEQSLPSAGLMQVMLDERDAGVFISGFSNGSPAEAAGAKKGDLIRSINGTAVEHFADVKIALIDQPPGAEIELDLQRSGLFGRERAITLKFKLSGEHVSPHP